MRKLLLICVAFALLLACGEKAQQNNQILFAIIKWKFK